MFHFSTLCSESNPEIDFTKNYLIQGSSKEIKRPPKRVDVFTENSVIFAVQRDKFQQRLHSTETLFEVRFHRKIGKNSKSRSKESETLVLTKLCRNFFVQDYTIFARVFVYATPVKNRNVLTQLTQLPNFWQHMCPITNNE